MSINYIFAVIAIIVFVKFVMQKTKEDQTKKGEAKQMATPVEKIDSEPQLEPVFLEKEDWSKYDSPAYLRKKKESQKGSEHKDRQKKSFNPKQSMADHKSRKQSQNKTVGYEEI